MVRGLDLFKEHFARYTDRYVLIGGTACSIAMEDAGLPFRSTKDLDLVLCVEALDGEFVRAFWEFIRSGHYENRQKSTGKQLFYRFYEPGDQEYPFMLELFSRVPDVLRLPGESHLTPIPVDEEVSSLSAILMSDEYYGFVQDGKQVQDGLARLSPEYLIPLKARAWLDLTERKAAGESIDKGDISKHRNDVFRLSRIIDPDIDIRMPTPVAADLDRFLSEMEQDDTLQLRDLGLGKARPHEVIEELRIVYGLDR